MRFERYLKYLIYGGLFASLFIPLFVADSLYFPFITGKNFAFRVIVELIFGSWVILALSNPTYRPRHSWILWSVLAFIVSIGISDVFGVLPSKSIWSNFERMEGWVTLLHFAAYFVVAGTVLTRDNLWKRFFNTSVFASALVGIYGILQLMGLVIIRQGGVRLDGTFGNATYLAIYMLFSFFITLFLFLRDGRKASRWLYSGAMALQLFIIYHTSTRGTILGLLGGILLTFFLIAFFEKGRPALRKFAIGGIVGVFIIIGGFFVLKDTSFVQNSPVLQRFASISLSEQTTSSRFVIWGMALQGLKDRPLLGWGQENFNYVFNKYYSPKLHGQELWFDRAHNAVFDWLVAGGVVGFLIYMSIFFSLLWCLWRKTNSLSVTEKSVLTGLVAGYFFSNLFVFDNITSYMMFAVVAAFIYGMTNRTSDMGVTRLIGEKAIRMVAIPVIVIATLFSLYFFSVKGILVSRTLLRAVSASTIGESMMLFDKALAYDTYGNQEIREALAQYSTRLREVRGVSADVKQDVFAFAYEEMQKQIEKEPNNARYYYIVAGMFSVHGGYDEAIAELEKALELSPNKPEIFLRIGAIEMERGRYQAGVDALEKAYNLNPESLPLIRNYAGGLLYLGRDSESADLLLPIFGTVLVPDPIIINAYVRRGDSQAVVTLWERRVFGFENEVYSNEGHSDNPQARISLAASYAQVGRIQEAIEQLEEAARLDPSLQDQVDFYLNDLRKGQ